MNPKRTLYLLPLLLLPAFAQTYANMGPCPSTYTVAQYQTLLTGSSYCTLPGTFGGAIYSPVNFHASAMPDDMAHPVPAPGDVTVLISYNNQNPPTASLAFQCATCPVTSTEASQYVVEWYLTGTFTNPGILLENWSPPPSRTAANYAMPFAYTYFTLGSGPNPFLLSAVSAFDNVYPENYYTGTLVYSTPTSFYLVLVQAGFAGPGGVSNETTVYLTAPLSNY